MILTTRFAIKAVVAGAGVVLALLSCLFDRRQFKIGQRTLAVVLTLLAIVSVWAYFEFGWLRYGIYMNPHDMFHYYMGSKYSREIGYYNLYRCALVADMEQDKVYRQDSSIRNLETHRYERVLSVLRKSDEYKSRFSDERWEEFKKDIRYFQSFVPSSKWNKMLRDKGYNGTPVWNMVARFLTNRVPTDSVWGMRLLTCLDPALLTIMFVLVWGAFGWRVTLFALIFYGTNFMMSWVHIKGGFLRLDWVTMLVMATCLLKKRHYKTAGMVMSYAGMARMFPVIFLFGMGAKPLFNVLKYLGRYVKTRKADIAEFWTANKCYVEFFAVFAVTSAILVGATLIDDGGTHHWKEFLHKINVHNRDFSTTRVGFKYILLWPWNLGERWQIFKDYHTVWLIVESVVLLVSFWLVQKLEDYETIAYGFVPAFFLTAPTFYYYVLLIVPLFLFAPKLRLVPRAIGLASLFLFSTTVYLIFLYTNWGLGRTLSFAMSCMLLAFALYVMFVSLVAAHAGTEEDIASQPVLASSKRPRLASPKRIDMLLKALVGVLGVVGVLLILISWWPRLKRAPETEPVAFSASHNGVELVFAGDVMLARNVAKSVTRNGGDYTFPFREVAPLVRGADVAFCNLECPISVRGELVPQRYTFRADPKVTDGLVYAGFDVVALANNHILDCGPTGLSETLSYLGDAGIHSVGVSEKGRPQTPAIFEVKDVRIGYLAYADPSSPYMFPSSWRKFTVGSVEADMRTIETDIARLKERVDIVVVSLHWGIEYETDHSERQEELGHFIIDHGADIVAGHHPHVQQDPEVYKDKLIIYSMGNFVFDQWSRPPTRQGRLYRVWVNKEGLVAADYIPLEIARHSWQCIPTATESVPVIQPQKQLPDLGVRIRNLNGLRSMRTRGGR